MTTARILADEIVAFVHTAAEGMAQRFFPSGALPRVLAGHVTFPGTRSLLLQLYATLHRLGIETLADMPLRDRVLALLREIRGAKLETWWSFTVAETLLAFGTDWDDHPLLRELTPAQVTELDRAIDSSRVIDLERRQLIGKPNNYWPVLARCEEARQRLGRLADTRKLDLAVARSLQFLAADAPPYLDDDGENGGRYDVYCLHPLTTGRPFWDRAAPDGLQHHLDAMRRLMLALARRDGASFCWGRSGGFASLDALLHNLSLTLEHQPQDDAPRLLALIANAAHASMQHWWSDDATSAHRHRRPHWYMGEGRLLEVSATQLSNLCKTAVALRRSAAQHGDLAVASADTEIYPQQDAWVPFDERGCGVWCYRRGRLDFQLPLVGGYNSDYAAAPVAPGCFEQIVDSGLACGVPHAFFGGKRYLPLRRPTEVRYAPGSLEWTTPCFSHFEGWDWWRGSDDVPGSRRAAVRVDGDTLHVTETWHFDTIPDILALHLAESCTPLAVAWDCPHPHSCATIAVDGMQAWRSHYHEITRVHQIDIEPAREVHVRYTLTPRT